MITLPTTTLSRGPLRAFGLVMGALLGAVTTVVGRRRRVARPWVAAAAVTVVGTAPVLLRPRLARRPYVLWRHGTQDVADLATRYATWVTHVTAVAPQPVDEAVTGGDSAWSVRRTQDADGYASLSPDPAHAGAPGQPLRVVHRWLADAGVPRRRWLLVCLGVLRWLQQADVGEARNVPRDTYTLY